MSTIRQTLLAKLVMEKGATTPQKELLAEAGYSPRSNILRSEAFIETLKGFGLTDELVTKALVEDIKEKPQNRTSELSLAADILRMKKRAEPEEEEDVPRQTVIIINQPSPSTPLSQSTPKIHDADPGTDI